MEVDGADGGMQLATDDAGADAAPHARSPPPRVHPSSSRASTIRHPPRPQPPGESAEKRQKSVPWEGRLAAVTLLPVLCRGPGAVVSQPRAATSMWIAGAPFGGECRGRISACHSLTAPATHALTVRDVGRQAVDLCEMRPVLVSEGEGVLRTPIAAPSDVARHPYPLS
eukprot:364916-Chlamydomonas_euryale.AAC.5